MTRHISPSRQNYRRVEFVLDKTRDQDQRILDYLEQVRASGGSVNEFIRQACAVAMGAETPPASVATRDDVEAIMDKLDRLEYQMSRLRAGDGAPDEPVLVDPDEARQNALSATLKRMNFNQLQ
jgi:hypothetical protein